MSEEDTIPLNELSEQDAKTEIKEEAQKRLHATNWTMLYDSPIKDDTELLAYRQFMRNIEQQEGFPYSIQWPSKPTVLED